MKVFLDHISYIIPFQMFPLTLLYIVLKLSGYLTLSWWFVASPIIVSILMFTGMIVICLVDEFLKKEKDL